MKKILFIFLFSSVSILAQPKSVEVIFLSRPVTSFLPTDIIWSQAIASNYECVEIEGGCFHPQLGFIDKKPLDETKEVKPKILAPDISNKDAVDSFEHDCDKNFKFDVFCGKGKRKPALSGFEVWVDTSSSMRGVDFSKDEKFCERRYWVSDLLKKCQKKLDVFIFNTVKRPLGISGDICQNEGSNNKVQMVEWIKASKAKSLLIVTDVEEYTNEFREYLNTIEAKVYGVGKDRILASNFSKTKTNFSSSCR